MSVYGLRTGTGSCLVTTTSVSDRRRLALGRARFDSLGIGSGASATAISASSGGSPPGARPFRRRWVRELNEKPSADSLRSPERRDDDVALLGPRIADGSLGGCGGSRGRAASPSAARRERLEEGSLVKRGGLVARSRDRAHEQSKTRLTGESGRTSFLAAGRGEFGSFATTAQMTARATAHPVDESLQATSDKISWPSRSDPSRTLRFELGDRTSSQIDVRVFVVEIRGVALSDGGALKSGARLRRLQSGPSSVMSGGVLDLLPGPSRASTSVASRRFRAEDELETARSFELRRQRQEALDVTASGAFERAPTDSPLRADLISESPPLRPDPFCSEPGPRSAVAAPATLRSARRSRARQGSVRFDVLDRRHRLGRLSTRRGGPARLQLRRQRAQPHLARPRRRLVGASQRAHQLRQHPRARELCGGGVVRAGQSGFVRLPPGGTLHMSDIVFDAPRPIPARLTLRSPLASAHGNRGSGAARGDRHAAGRALADVTPAATGTNYRTSNPAWPR